MGYDEREHALIEDVLAFEKAWQASPDPAERRDDLEFMRESTLDVLDILTLLARHRQDLTGLRGVEIGAGSGWVSWLFAEAGVDMWLCELEPNSLYLGTLYAHERIAAGRRIVCDASYPPFSDGVFDLVVCKQFAHHVRAYERLFREANRILRPGGLLVLYEPTKSLTGIVHYSRHPDPVPEHHYAWPLNYVRALRRAGFEIRESRTLRVRQARRVPFTRWANRRASRLPPARNRSPSDWVARAFVYVVGGEFLVFAEKVDEASREPRPTIRVIDPAVLTATPEDRDLYEPFRQLLLERARGIVR
ncbi:hypothetical protein BH20ACT13_BH20ACT13_16170 [soil metagenome]